MTDNDTTIIREGEVYTFRLLWRVVQRQLQNATAKPHGSISDLMAALTFAAFTVEAFVNFVGVQLYQEAWLSKYERKPTNKKIKLVLEKLNLAYKDIPEPVKKTLNMLKILRDDLAHGKPYLSLDNFNATKVRTSRENFYKLQFKAPLYEKLEKIGFEGSKKIIEDVNIFANFINAKANKEFPDLVLDEDNILSGALSRAVYVWPETETNI
ncbi:hypothetical protein [Komagataeibacter xylinus]|uniref:hypothetical protein n=1 Tax=Komagataeibacter xylinus TaxID=28448 RepID=UPI001031FAD3|nr:hypothetical protein [Komagataeibacter xylinus]